MHSKCIVTLQVSCRIAWSGRTCLQHRTMRTKHGSPHKWLGLCTQTAGVEAQQGALFREKMEGVERWMELRGLPRHMRTDIVSYYSEVWTQHQGMRPCHSHEPHLMSGRTVSAAVACVQGCHSACG